uniref:Protein phosphatase methylesterase 1 n=1 Tax=Rhabditophanes sp. KR3021 TaxID=114890 RepID=A0AC35TXB7_9BILA
MTEHNYLPLMWDQYFEERKFVDVEGDTFCCYLKGKEGPVFFLIHGASYSGLTWATLTKELTQQIECRVVAVDLRGHGSTETSNDKDLAIGTVVKDLERVYLAMFGEEKPKLIVVGHSFGGSIAIHLVSALPNVQLLSVIDVVEGSAMAALHSMRTLLDKRPKSFNCVEEAIHWCVNTHSTNNLESARISMPDQIKKGENGKYVFKVDLYETEKFWSDWFTGISSLFLKAVSAKILILANTDRLDKDLTFAHMAGKFQLEVLRMTGHTVQEDKPKEVADIFIKILKRYKMVKCINE